MLVRCASLLIVSARTLPVAYPERAAWGTVPKLRAWQAEALEMYRTRAPKDFLAVATPGAGKTTFALDLVAALAERHGSGHVGHVPNGMCA